MHHFQVYTRSTVLQHTKLRRHETKLGERISVLNGATNISDQLKESSAVYVVFGIAEDIGVKANFGIGGAKSGWHDFAQAFLNTQVNDWINPNAILFLGCFNFDDLDVVIASNAETSDEKIDAYRHAVTLIDNEVETLVQLIIELGKIPIAIGGGHNNAYPLLKGTAKGLLKNGSIKTKFINAINLDAHTDYRIAEGRHSGNGFRYAKEEGYLNRYAIVGLHENYIGANILKELEQDNTIDFISYEDIFLHEKKNFIQAVSHATGFTESSYAGIELDLDAIENTLSSAMSPAGVSLLHARQYVSFAATDCKVAYLHICEGASQLADGKSQFGIGKMITYLVTDFIKAHAAMI